MKISITFLWLFVSWISATGEVRDAFDEAMLKQPIGLGRSYTFTHLGGLNKRLNDNITISFLGFCYGIKIMIPGEVKAIIPDSKSWVEIPGGNRISLVFKNGSINQNMSRNGLGIFAQPHKMVNGLYKYHITLIIDGKEISLDHNIKIGIKELHNDNMESIDDEG